MSLLMAEKVFVEKAARGANLTIVNAVWVATALLHRAHPERKGFGPEEIVQLVTERRMTEGAKRSIRLHVNQHSIANKKPQPNRACMLFDPGDGLRRLFRHGDRVNPGKDATRTHPDWEDLPSEYKDLQRWYEDVWEKTPFDSKGDPLFALIGTWNGGGESADEYVGRLRADWGETR